MEKQEHKSKWDDLAREIGAEVPPETEQREESLSTTEVHLTQETQVVQSTTTILPPLPKRPAADWAGLTAELGLPPIEEEAPVAEEPTAKQPPREQTPAAQPRESQGREPQPRRPRSDQHGRRDKLRDEPRDERRDEGESQGRRRERGGQRRSRQAGRDRQEGRERHGGRGRHADRDRQEGRRVAPESRRETRYERRDTHELPREQRDMDTESVEESREFEPPQGEAPTPAPPVREEPAKSPAMSLWHKIFGSPAEQTAKLSEPPADEVSSSDVTDDVRETETDLVGGSSIRSLSGEDVTAADFIVSERDGGTAQDEAGQDERQRGRSRRRRRGGRGRKSSDRHSEGRSAEPRVHESPGADEIGGDFDDIDDDFGDLGGAADLADSTQRASDAERDDADSDLETAGDARARSAAQRAIPSWDDAIGFIVDTNMQSRSQRRPPSRSDSRGNSSRGRSRGGRRK